MSGLKEIVKEEFALAKAFIEGGKDEVRPTFLAILENGDRHIYFTPWGSDDEKDAVFKYIRLELKTKSEIYIYVFISEVWAVKGVKKGDLMDLPPSKHPRRIEALMVDGWTRPGEHVSLMAEVNSDRKVLEPDSEFTDSISSGCAVNLFEVIPSADN